MPPIARGQTWLCQPLPVSTVPNTGRNLSNSNYRGLNEEDYLSVNLILVCAIYAPSLLVFHQLISCCVALIADQAGTFIARRQHYFL